MVSPAREESGAILRLKIQGMDCAEEVSLLRSALAPLIDPESMVFDVLRAKLTVRLPAGEGHLKPEILEAIASTGLQAEDWPGRARPQGRGHADTWRLLACAISGVLLLAGYVWHGVLHGFLHALASEEHRAHFPLGSVVAYAGSVAGGMWLVLPRAWTALRHLRPDMNLLMVIAVSGALSIGEWFEASVVSFLFALALLLESWSGHRARRAIEALLDLAPDTARVVGAAGTENRDVPAADVEVGAVIAVRAGERIPLDGVVLEGESSADEATLTGESMPVAKRPGDEVFSGTINVESPLRVRVLRPSGDSTLARIIHMVEDAQARQAPVERWAERFAARYTPAILGIAIAVAVLPPVLGLAAWGEAFYRALVVLVVACPCALVISTPVSIVASLASAARGGVLVKGGAYLESAAALRAIALDKTGTLTLGEPVVEQVVALEGHAEADVLAIAAALEARSNHPLANAVVAHAREQGVPLLVASGTREKPGKGIEGTIDGRATWVGGLRLLNEWVRESGEAHAVIADLEALGLTTVVVGDEDHVLGVMGLADAIRPSATTIVNKLHAVGVQHVVMLTGDHERAALRVARVTGIEEVRAGLLPPDKVQAVEAFTRTHGVTAMVGDGVNDAPALAAARVGIAMGAVGSDVAIETADVALMSGNLERIPWLIALAKRTLRVIRQNVTLALGAKVLVLGLAFLGVASLWMAIAADMGASLIVIANALRLLRT